VSIFQLHILPLVVSERSASGEFFFWGGGGVEGGGLRTKKFDNPVLASLQPEHGFSRIFKASSSQSMLQDVCMAIHRTETVDSLSRRRIVRGVFALKDYILVISNVEARL
jgi:hypothetical protein